MFAGAAFTDSADIKVDTEVVDTLVSLGVVNGYDDGSFKPNGTVTRAEMAKMIYVLRTGNSDASAYNDDKTSFTDIGSHWARGYIKYCQSLGIIAGKSNTKFVPNEKVSAQEAAKMLLVTLGYDAQKAGLVGTGWASKTNALADENGLLEDVNTSFTSACPRQYAAQLIYNAIDAKTVVLRDGEYTDQTAMGVDNKTVGEKYMNLKKTTSTLTKVSKTNGKDTYELTLDEKAVNWDNTTETKASGKAVFDFTDVQKDYSDLLYKTVTVLHKDRKTVYGVFATSDNTQQSNVLKKLKMDGSKAKLNGTKYDLAAADKQTVYVNGDDVTAEMQKLDTKKSPIENFITKYGDGASDKYTDSKYWQGTEVSLMATDGTSNYSILKVKTFAVAKVTAVGSDYINVTVKKGDTSLNNGKTKLEDDEWDWYDGVKKDDYVILTAKGNYGTNHGLVEKANVVSGKVTGTKSTDSVSVGGNWYTMAGVQGQSNTDKRPNTGSNVDMVVVNGYVYNVETTAGNVDDMALLVEAAAKGGTGSKWEARLIFTDGSDKTVDIEKYWGDKDNKKFPIVAFSEGTAANPNLSAWDTTANLTATSAAPMLVTYEKSGDVYTLSRVGIADIVDNSTTTKGDFALNGYDAYVDATVGMKTDGSIKNASDSANMKVYTAAADTGLKDTGASLSKLYYESTGVVFVKYKSESGTDADYKVVTGKTASDYSKTLRSVAAVANKSGNSYYAQVAVIDLAGLTTGGGSDNYAIVTGDVVKNTENGTVYEIPAWNGTEAITVKTDDSAAKSLNKGDLFTYTGDVANADIDAKSADNYYVSNYDEGSGDITLLYKGADNKFFSLKSGDKYNKVDSKDTIVMYVNSDDSTGVASGSIDMAYLFDSDFCTLTKGATGTQDLSKSALTTSYTTYTSPDLSEDNAPNVKAYFDDDDQITVLVVDVNRNITKW